MDNNPPSYPQSNPPPMQPQMPPQMQMQPPQPPGNPNEKASFVLSIIGMCFGGLAAAWSLFGGACCGWAGWGFALVGLVLSIISLSLKRSVMGWVSLGLAIFAFVWVFISAFIITAGTAGAINSAAQSGVNSTSNINRTQRQR